MSPRPGTFESVLVSLLSSSPASAKLWPSRSSTPVLARRVRKPGNQEAVKLHAVGEVKRGYFRLQLQTNVIFVDDGRLEIQTDTVFLENDAYSTVAATATALDYGHRILTAGEEARLLTVHRDQVWLGESAQRALCLQGAYHGGHIAAQDQKVETTKCASQDAASDAQ